MQMPVKQRLGIGTIEVEKLRLDGGTQPREKMDDQIAYEYGAAMRDHGVNTFDPIIVYYDGESYWLADGFHRVTGATQFGVANLRADIRQGTRRDAVLFSAGANARHGLRRTNADKRRAVELLLRDDEWQQWSDREIASKCGVTHPFVGDIRKELTGNDFQSDRPRIGADGRTINTKNIGATPKSEPSSLVASPVPAPVENIAPPVAVSENLIGGLGVASSHEIPVESMPALQPPENPFAGQSFADPWVADALFGDDLMPPDLPASTPVQTQQAQPDPLLLEDRRQVLAEIKNYINLASADVDRLGEYLEMSVYTKTMKDWLNTELRTLNRTLDTYMRMQ